MKLLKWQKVILIIYPIFQGSKFINSVIAAQDFNISGIILGFLWLGFTTGILALLFWIGNKIYFKITNKKIENANDHNIVIKILKIFLTILITGSLILIFLGIFDYSFTEISILLSALVTATVFFMIVMCAVIIGRILGKPLKKMFTWATITLSVTYGSWLVVFIYSLIRNY